MRRIAGWAFSVAVLATLAGCSPYNVDMSLEGINWFVVHPRFYCFDYPFSNPKCPYFDYKGCDWAPDSVTPTVSAVKCARCRSEARREDVLIPLNPPLRRVTISPDRGKCLHGAPAAFLEVSAAGIAAAEVSAATAEISPSSKVATARVTAEVATSAAKIATATPATVVAEIAVCARVVRVVARVGIGR